ncbi:phage tail tape measure protein [Loktanella salsilacus]|uniref:phage tail tape measure protein n=1 Tax=Loktanella salsilacus TaxID=195913 RepID=UPI0037046D98
MSRDQKLKSTITIGAAVDGSIKSSVSFIKNGLASVGSEIKTVTKRQQELGKQRRVLEKQGESVAHLDREYEDLARTLVDLERKQERYNRAAAASRRVGSTFKSMATSVRRDARNIAVGATAAAGAIFGIAASTAALGDNVAKTADRLGIGIGALQELRYAAERTGVDVGTFDKAIEGMQKRLGEAAGGTGTAVDALKALGLSASDLIKMEPDAAFYAIADAMANIGTVAERTALSSDVFGRSGVALLNMTREGSAGLEEYGRQAQRTGNILSDEAARDAEVFQDRLLDAQMVVKGLKNTIGAELMPVVSDAMERFSNYVIENRAQVELWATTFADRVGAAMPVVMELAGGVGRMMSVTGSAAAAVADLVGGWDNFGVIIAGLALGRSIVAVGRFAGAVGQLGWALIRLAGAGPLVSGALRMIGSALLANPIGLAVAAIAGGAYLIYKNWDKVGPWFSNLWDGVRRTFGGVVDFVVGVFTLDMDRAASGIKAVWSGVSDFFTTYLDGIANAFRWTWDGTIGPVVEKLAATDGVQSAWQTVKTTVGAVLDWLSEKFAAVWEGISPVIDGLKWVGEKGAAAISALPFGKDAGSVMDGPAPVGATQGSTSAAIANLGIPGGAPSGRSPYGIPLQTNAAGGEYRPGWHLTGELGPELKFETRSGFVATNRQLRQMADMSDRASRPAPASGGSQVVQHITHQINATGLSVDELIGELKRRERQASSSALFDRVPGTGFAGR